MIGGRPTNEFLQLLTAGVRRPLEVPLLVLGLYIDESADGKTYVVCGVLASVGSWDRLGCEWNKILAREPALPYWHQSDVYAREEPFDVLSEDQIRDREVWLSSEVRALNPRIIATAMSARDYEAEQTDWIRSANLLRKSARKQWLLRNSPYSVLHTAWVEQMHREPDAFGVDERALVIIEASDDLKRDEETTRWVRGWNQYYLDKGRPNRIYSVATQQGKLPESRPLEAVDMAAWVVRRRLSGSGPHHLSNRILEQQHPVRYIELEARAIRSFFGLTANVDRIERESR